MSLPFSEWTREQKDEYAKRRMEEMKLKNVQFKERYAEVEKDRIEAEENNSSITNGKVQKKSDKDLDSSRDPIPPKKPEREWDKGKCNPDTNDWSPPNFHANYEFPSRGTRRNYNDRRNTRSDNWRCDQRSSNASREQPYFSKSETKFHKSEYHKQGPQASNTFRNESTNNYRRFKSGGQRSYGNSKLGDPRKKSFDVCSASPSCSDWEIKPKKNSSKDNDRMVWRDGSHDVVERRQVRVESWVKSVNISANDQGFIEPEEYFHQDQKEDLGYHEENIRNYDLREDLNRKKIHPSREQTYVKNKNKSDHKNNRAIYTNVSGSRSKNSMDNKVYTCPDVINERNIRRNEKKGNRQESVMNDRSSNMKESVYRDWDEIHRDTTDHSDWKVEAVPEPKPPRSKLPNYYNYEKDTFNNSKSLKSPKYCNEKKVKNPVTDENSKHYRCSRDKDEHQSRNLKLSDYENTESKDEGICKPHMQKLSHTFDQNKFRNFKVESKLESHQGGLEVNRYEISLQNNPMDYQSEKKSFNKTISSNFPESSIDEGSRIPFNDQHHQNVIDEPYLKSTYNDPHKSKMLWADYVVSDEIEESVSVDSVIKRDTMPDWPEVKSITFENSNSRVANAKNVISDEKCSVESVGASLNHKRILELKTSPLSSYTSDNSTEIEDANENFEISAVRSCKIVPREKSNADYDNKEQNVINVCGAESKENIKVVLEFPVLNKKEVSSDIFENSNTTDNISALDLSDEAGWSTVSDDEDD